MSDSVSIDIAQKAAQKAAQIAAQKASQKAIQQGASKSVQKTAQKAVQETAEIGTEIATKTGFKAALATNVGNILGSVVDIVFGSMAIAEASKLGKNVQEERKTTEIVGQVGGMVINVAINFIAGPLMFVIIAIQLIGMLVIDMSWNPFKNYYNSDLSDIKDSIDSQIKKSFNQDGVHWPLEVKPNFLSGLDSTKPDYEKNLQLFRDFRQKYYDDNGLIKKEDVIAEEKNLFKNIFSMRQMRRVYSSEDVIMDPVSASISIGDYANTNMLELLPLAVRAKKLKELRSKTSNNTLKFIKDFFYTNIPIFISSFLIIFFLSIIIIKYLQDNV